MSYDLMVFDHTVAPANRKDFLVWYEEQTKWSEDHSYDDPAVTATALQAWFCEMIESYPAINGPYAIQADDLPPTATDYCIGRSVIYASFRWSQAEDAFLQTCKLADKLKVGFFDASSTTPAIWRPDTGLDRGNPQPGET